MEKETQTKEKKVKMLTGVVTSDKMDKTAVVEVVRFSKHPIYGKFVKTKKKYKAHDQANAAKVGDKVTIKPCKPMSKDKKFEIVEA